MHEVLLVCVTPLLTAVFIIPAIPVDVSVDIDIEGRGTLRDIRWYAGCLQYTCTEQPALRGPVY